METSRKSLRNNKTVKFGLVSVSNSDKSGTNETRCRTLMRKISQNNIWKNRKIEEVPKELLNVLEPNDFGIHSNLSESQRSHLINTIYGSDENYRNYAKDRDNADENIRLTEEDLDGDCYFPKDGYDYEQHLAVINPKNFIPIDNSVDVEDFEIDDHKHFPGLPNDGTITGKIDDHSHTLDVDAKYDDLFDDGDDVELLDDDFVIQASNEELPTVDENTLLWGNYKPIIPYTYNVQQFDIDDTSKNGPIETDPPFSLDYNLGHTSTYPPEHNLAKSPSLPEVSPAVSSSNYLPVNGIATPRDRGESEGGDASRAKDVTSGGIPAADLREAEGEVNRRADGRNVTSGGKEMDNLISDRIYDVDSSVKTLDVTSTIFEDVKLKYGENYYRKDQMVFEPVISKQSKEILNPTGDVYVDLDQPVTDESYEEDEELSDYESDKWDVETVLTTYTNNTNHPRVIVLDKIKSTLKKSNHSTRNRNMDGIDIIQLPEVITERRKDETIEEKKARKASVKNAKAMILQLKRDNKDALKAAKKKNTLQNSRGNYDVTDGVRYLKL